MRLMRFITTFSLLYLCTPNFAQEWVNMLEDPKANFYDVQQKFKQEWGTGPYVRGKGWKQFKRWEAFLEPRLHPHGQRHMPNKAWKEHEKFQNTYRIKENPQLRAGNWTPLGPNTWQTVSYNPGNGRVNVITEDPNDPNTIYAGVPSGGCWKSTDNGNSWTVLTDDLPVLGVSAIVVDHTNSNIVYIGTGDGDGSDTYSIGVLKSTDGGATWNTTGLSWNTLNARVMRKMVMHPTNSSIIWAGSNDGLYKTSNGGTTWTQVLAGSIRDIELKPNDPNTVYASTDEFFVSTDGGTTWNQTTTGLPGANNVNRVSIAVSAANPDYVYYLAGDQSDASFLGLYRSTNAGQSFTLQSNSPNLFTYADDGNGTGGQSWYDMALAANPNNANEIYVGGINVWKSTDGGVNWTISTHWYYPPNVGYVHADIHTLDFFGGNLYCGSDGGIFRTTNGGNSWADLSQGMSIMQFYRFGGTQQNADLLIGGSQDNGTNLYANNVWTHVIGADGMEAAIDPSDSDIMYGCIQNGGLRRSTNGGANFSSIVNNITENGPWVTPFVIDPNAPSTLYAGYENIWKSTDRGDNWTQISNIGGAGTPRAIAVAPSNSDYIYYVTLDDVYRTTNGGTTWAAVTNNLPNSGKTYIAVDPNDPLHIWVTCSGFTAGDKVFTSTDGGINWTNISGNLPNLPVNCIIYQNGSNDAIYVGTDVGIYYKDNSITNWVPFMDGLPNVIVNELEIHYGTSKLRAATYGRSVWESDLYTPSTLPPEANFSFTDQTLCAGDSISFADLSINAAPGWEWQFPGGSPATSTDAAPKVAYTSSGTYTATLIVMNANGNDTITKNVDVVFGSDQVNVNIQLDNYPGETSWQLVDQSGVIVWTGGGYSGLTNQLVNETSCLSTGCYDFTIYDSYGDGICCGFGSGYYEVTDINGTVLATGGNFGSDETVTVCFNAPAPLVVNGTQTTDSECGANNGTIILDVDGGDGNYEYSTDGGNTFQTGSDTLTNLAGGFYTIIVQDGSGNSITTTATITEPNPPTAVASSSVASVDLTQGSGQVLFYNIGSTGAFNYSWDFGDGNTATGAPAVNVYTTPGIYDVVLSAIRESCVDTDTIQIEVLGITDNVSLTELQEANIQVLPNPTTEKFNLKIDLAEAQDLEISIYDVLGRRVFWEEVQQLESYNRLLHFGNEADGVYIVSVQGKNIALSKKFVKVGK